MGCNDYRQTINTKKTEVMHRPGPGKQYVQSNIIIKRQQLKVLEFTYLSSIISRSIVMGDEVNTGLAKVSAAFGLLNKNVWDRRCISWASKSKLCQVVILTALLYGCETWTTYQRHITKLNRFITTCLRKMLGFTWQKHIPITEVLTLVSLPSICTILMQSQLRSACHVVCMKDNQLTKNQLYAELSHDIGSQGGQKKRFKDTLKVSMKSLGIVPNYLEYLSQNIEKRWDFCHTWAKVYETRRNSAIELRR